MIEDMELAKAAVSTYAFTTTFCRDPTDNSQSWEPNAFQKIIYDVIDYGYDVAHRDIEPPEPVDTVLISCPRQQGKTEGLATATEALAIRFPGSEIGIMSNNNKNAKKMIRRIYNHFVASGFSEYIQNHNSETIELVNGSIIDCYGMTENIRSNSYTWLIVDEAAQFTEKVLVDAAMPTTRSAGAYRKWGTPSIILLSTPAGTNGKFADFFMKAISERRIGCKECRTLYDKSEFKSQNINWFEFWNTIYFPNDEMPPCPNCGETNYEYVDRYYSIVRSDPYLIFDKEEVQRELAARGNTPGARQELLGEFIGAGNNVFRREWLEQCVDTGLDNSHQKVPGVKYYMGVDFGKTHDATVFCVVHEHEGRIIFDWIDYIVGEGLEYSDIRLRLIEEIAFWKPIWVIPDATGLGDPVCEQMEKDIRELRLHGITIRTGTQPDIIEKEFQRQSRLPTKIYSNKKDHYGFIFDMNSKPECIDNLTTILSHQEISIPPEQIYKVDKLWRELIGFGFERTSTGRIKYGVQNTHDDFVIALALACWGLKERPFINGNTTLGGKDSFVYSTNSKIPSQGTDENYSIGFGSYSTKRF